MEGSSRGIRGNHLKASTPRGGVGAEEARQARYLAGKGTSIKRDQLGGKLCPPGIVTVGTENRWQEISPESEC